MKIYDKCFQGTGMFSLLKTQLWGDMIVFRYMRAYHSEDGSGLSAVAPEGKTRINGFKLQ